MSAKTQPKPKKPWRSVLCSVLCSVLLMAMTSLGAAAQDSLRVTFVGQVFAEETGKPLAGAHIFVAHTRYGAATDTYGIYRIDDVPLGDGQLVVTMPGYMHQSTSFHITEQATYRHNATLVKTDDLKLSRAVWAQGLAVVAVSKTFDVRQADAFVRSVFHDEDEGLYEQAAATYLALLDRLDAAGSEEEQTIIRRHVAQVEFLLPDAVRAAVVEAGYLRGQGTLRPKEGAGAVLTRWWRSKDPLPNTSRNERLEKHLARVAYAEDRYEYRQGLRGFDDRGEIYVQLGRPTFQQTMATDGHVTQALLDINGPPSPEAELWTYRHLDEDIFYLFMRRNGRYQTSDVHDLVPSVLKRGFSDTPRGRRISQVAITYLHGVYRQMIPAHPDYEDLFTEIDLYRSGMGHNARIKPDAFARSMVEQIRFKDHEMKEYRRQFAPLEFAPVLGEAERLPVQVRYARFLDPDGSTRTEVYTGHLPVPEDERTRTETRHGEALDYRIESTLVRWDADYRERNRRQSRYRIPASSEAVQTLVFDGDTASYGFTLQWDAHLDSRTAAPTPASRLRTGVFRTETVHPLSNDEATLEMSDLKPIFAPDAADVAYESGDGSGLERTPYPFMMFAPEVAPSLYFEIYHLAFGDDDRVHYTVEYEVVRRKARMLGLLGTKEERAGASSPYTGDSRTVQELIMIDLSQWKEGGEALSITIRVTDDVTGRQVERHIDFTL